MSLWSNASPSESAKIPLHGFRLLIEPEPWIKIFLRNLADLFRAGPPPAWVSSQPGLYWDDALVHRPVAWKFMQVSLLAHILFLASAIGASWLVQDQPVVLNAAPKTNTIIHYQLSEYLPAVRMQPAEETPVRAYQQEADPELAPQKIVVLNADHNSTRQTIVQPDLTLLRQDVPMPNIVAWTLTAIPGPPVAARHQLMELPAAAPQLVAPAQQALQHNANQLVFPLPAQPQVVSPAAPLATNSSLTILAMPGPMVVAPAPDAAMRDPGSLQLPAQAPPQVAAPSSSIASARKLAQAIPGSDPQVVPPTPNAGRRDLTGMGLPGAGQNVAPPAQPVTAGSGPAQAREMGQLLALNAHPAPPSGPLRVPEGNRQGEFTAGPEGHTGASGAPETRLGDHSPAGGSGDSAGQGSIYVSPPPTKVTGAVVVASAAPLPNNTDVPSSDSVESRVFGARKNYGMRLSMPNLASAMGSWSVRFAELNPDSSGSGQGEIIAPEAIRKVDPAYPAAFLRDRIEGVVVLHAVIHSDGSVGDVRVLEGFNAQLDANACYALEHWRFRPGLKNGVPIDVEAVIRVPFKAKQAF
jgi:TonB family protein